MATAVPYRSSTPATAPSPYGGVDLRESILGNLGLWAALGVSLLVLGFAAGIALDNVDEAANDARGALAGIPAVLVMILPFVAAPVLALGTGAWSGHATRSARLGAIAGALGGLLGPIILILLAAIGLALGAGAAGVDLDAARMPYDLGNVSEWRNALPYLLSGAGFFVLLASILSGAIAGAVVGSMMEGRWRTWGAGAHRGYDPGHPPERPRVRI